MDIIYVALHMLMRTFLCKDNFSKALHMYGSWGKGSKVQSFLLKMEPFNNFYIDEAQMALDIFNFAGGFVCELKIFLFDVICWAQFTIFPIDPRRKSRFFL